MGKKRNRSNNNSNVNSSELALDGIFNDLNTLEDNISVIAISQEDVKTAKEYLDVLQKIEALNEKGNKNQKQAAERYSAQLRQIEKEIRYKQEIMKSDSKSLETLKEQTKITKEAQLQSRRNDKTTPEDKEKINSIAENTQKELQAAIEEIRKIKHTTYDKKNSAINSAIKQREITIVQYGINSDEYKDATEDLADVIRDEEEKSRKDIGKKVTTAITNIGNKITGGISASIDNAVKNISQNNGTLMARLQGSDFNYRQIISSVTDKYSTNSLLSTEKLVENINKMASQGIYFDLESRATLATLSEKMVATFDALEPTLQRLIRVQQFNSTSLALGTEAEVTQLLNGLFGDSTYLNSLYDSVNSAILDANAQKSAEDAAEFTYAVQKWLGALYSVGMSESTVGTIASGLNALATGDVQALSSNSALTNLFGLSAKEAGISYASMLTGGIDAETTNDLLFAMVNYLKDISNNTDNQVTLNEWSKLLGMSVADIKAFSNLNTDNMGMISSNKTVQNILQTTVDQVNSLQGRTILAEQLDNLLGNLLYSGGTSIAVNDDHILGYKATKFISDFIKTYLPDINIAGTNISGIASLVADMLGVAPALENIFSNTFDGIGDMGFSGIGKAILSGFKSNSIAQALKVGLSYGNNFDSSILGLDFNNGGTITLPTVNSSLLDFNYSTNNANISEPDETTLDEIENNVETKTHDINDLYKALFDENRPVHVTYTSNLGDAIGDLAYLITD